MVQAEETRSRAEVAKMKLNCQSFRQGCCGCCLNMRWAPDRIRAFLGANTDAAGRFFPAEGRPGLRDLVRFHLARGGWIDHLLMFWLVPPTLAISAWTWSRYYASCCFAGYIDESAQRVGCLIHPLRIGLPDLRRHAFPLVPTANCDRELRCPMLDSPLADVSLGNLEASRQGWKSIKKGLHDSRPGGLMS